MTCVFGDEGIRTESLCSASHRRTNYLDLHNGGVSAAFSEEVRLENPACPDALRTLREHFSSETSPSPMKASHFGRIAHGESEDIRFERATIRQDMVDAAERLLKAGGQ